MKRDLLAAFTFILTGILFYSLGHRTEAKDLRATGLECWESQAIMVVDEVDQDAPAEISFLEEGRRDS